MDLTKRGFYAGVIVLFLTWLLVWVLPGVLSNAFDVSAYPPEPAFRSDGGLAEAGVPALWWYWLQPLFLTVLASFALVGLVATDPAQDLRAGLARVGCAALATLFGFPVLLSLTGHFLAAGDLALLLFGVLTAVSSSGAPARNRWPYVALMAAAFGWLVLATVGSGDGTGRMAGLAYVAERVAVVGPAWLHQPEMARLTGLTWVALGRARRLLPYRVNGPVAWADAASQLVAGFGIALGVGFLLGWDGAEAAFRWHVALMAAGAVAGGLVASDLFASARGGRTRASAMAAGLLLAASAAAMLLFVARTWYDYWGLDPSRDLFLPEYGNLGGIPEGLTNPGTSLAAFVGMGVFAGLGCIAAAWSAIGLWPLPPAAEGASTGAEKGLPAALVGTPRARLSAIRRGKEGWPATAVERTREPRPRLKG